MGLKEQLQWEDQSIAKNNLFSAYVANRPAEQSAQILSKARELNVTPTQAELVTPEEDAERLTNKANLAGIQAMAPVLVEKMREPNFANLVREDLGNMGMLEKLATSLAAEPGVKPTTISQSLANGLTTGLFDLVTNQREAVDLKKQIDEINATDALLASGKTAQEVFGDEEDPVGAVGMAAFAKRKERLSELQKQYENALEKARYHEWRNQQYPVSETTDKIFAAGDSLSGTLSAVKEQGMYGFGQFLADTVSRSVVSQLPGIAGAALASAVGAPVAVSAGLMGLFSAALDYESQVTENLKESGVDFMHPRKAAQSMTPEATEKAENKAALHALPVGMLDAASLGIASKVLLPKAMVARWAEAPVKRQFANMTVQMPVGGALGGLGEAGGQIAADGRITSWADVVAEVAGEHAMAPLEVASTALEARSESLENKARAQVKADIAKRLNDVIQGSAVAKIDPTIVSEHMKEAAERAGLKSVSLDGTALAETDLIQKSIGISQQTKEKFEKARQEGSSVELSLSEALMLMNENPEIAGYLSFNGEPSVNEANAQDEEVQTAASRKLEAIRSVNVELFNAEVAEVGRSVGDQVLKATGSEEETQVLQAVIQTFVAANALDLGMSPKQFWQEYGASILGEPDVKRDAKGNLVKVEGKTPSQWKNSESYKQASRILSDVFSKAKTALEERINRDKHRAIGGKLTDAERKVLSKRARENDSYQPYLSVDDKQREKAKASGIDLSEFKDHVVSVSGVSHLIERHGGGFEKRTNQVPVTSELFQRIIDVIMSYDSLKEETRKGGKKSLVYEKRFDDGTVMFVEEEIRQKEKRNPDGSRYIEKGSLAVKSFWMKRAPGWDYSSLKGEAVPHTPEAAGSTAIVKGKGNSGQGSFSQASKGDFYPTSKLVARWKNDAFSQSWGKFEKFKNSIVDIKEKFVGSYKDLAKHLSNLSGKELKLGTSGTATLNSKGVKEIVRRPDPTRKIDENVFKTAVSNIESLLANSVYGWSSPDRKSRPDIDHIEKHFSGFVHEGRPYSARITIRVIAEPNAGKKVYEVDAIEIESLESGLDWVRASHEKDAELTKNSPMTEVTEEGTRRQANPLQDASSVTPISPEVQELIEALLQLRNSSFSQASKGDFYPTLKLIARWKNADRSTLLHETGHMFLEARMQAYADLLKRGGPKTEGEKHFAENMQSVLKFVGVKSVEQWQAMAIDQKRKGHEKFARSFEAWLMLGKAPSENLEGVFAQFASWLKKLYICLAGIPGAQFDDSVQEMFSSMFLAEAQIREAQIRHNVYEMFASAEEAGMSAEEFASYHQDINDMIADAEAEQTERNARLSERINSMRRKALRELQGEVKGELKRLRDEEQKAFEATKIYQAWDKIHNGSVLNGKKISFKLPFAELIKLGITRTQLEKLHKAGLAVKQPRKDGLPLDDLAAGLGYPDAKTMVDDLLDNLNPREVINQRAADRFVKENPELATPQQIQDAAAASMFNSAKMKVLAAELKAFLRMARQQNVEANISQISALAKQTISQMKYSAIKPQRYITEANRARRQAREAWVKGDMEGAIKAKRRELGFAAMAKAAKEALTQRSKFKHSFDKFKQKVKRSVDQRYWELIQRALANMGLFTEEQLALNPEVQTFIAEVNDLMNATGCNLDVFKDVIDAVTRKDSAFLETPEGFERFKDFIATVEKLGRDEKHFTLEGKKIELDKLEKAGADSVRTVADAHGRGEKRAREKRGKLERFKNWLVKFGLSQARASALVAVLDGGYDGILTRAIIHPYGHCANKYAELQAKFSKEIDSALSPILKDLRKRRPLISKVFKGAEFTMDEVFTMLLNYGNEGNRQRLAETLAVDFNIDILGSYDPKDPVSVAQAWARADATMDAFFQEMIPDTRFFKAAEAVWATFEKSRQEVDAVIKRMNGRTPVWVQPKEVRIGSTTLTGGYYPIVYDRKASLSGARLANVDSISSLTSIFSNQGVASGHLKGRLEKYKKPITLTTRALFEGLNEQTYYCAYAEYINDMRKLLGPDSPIAKAIHERYGSEYYQALMDWLQDIRDNGKGKTTSADGFATLLRLGVAIVGIGFNFGVAAIQVVGLTQSTALIGSRWVARGQVEALKLGTKANAWVCGKSAMMRDRTRTQFREVSEINSKINGSLTFMEKLQNAAYVPLTMVQLMVDIPTWLGAYQKALHEGKTDSQAVDLADWAVMNSQGSGRPGELSAVERGSPWIKLFTVFYTFFNTALNLAVVSGKTEDTMKAAAKIFTICILQPVLEYGIREAAATLLGQEDDEDDDEEFWVKHLKGATIASLQFDTGMVFGVREFASAMGEYGYRGPTAMRKIIDSAKAFNDAKGIMFEDKEFSERALRDFISALGSWTGIPVSPINKAIKGYNLIEEGKSDSYFSLITGK